MLNRSPNRMANWVMAAVHSRWALFQSLATPRKTRYKSLIGLVGGEMPAAAHGGAERAVEALDGIGGVEDPPHLRREGKERDHLRPLPPPQRSDGRVFLAPRAGFEVAERQQRSVRRRRLVDRFQRRHHLAAILPGHV